MARILKNGWQRNNPDHRDLKIEFERMSNLPKVVDLRSSMPKVYDQGDLGSCVLNATGAAIEHQLKTQKLTDFMPSRLFMYYNTRVIEGTVNSDAGCQIRDAIKSVVNQGVCSEDEWNYDVSKFTEKPSDQCYKDALLNIVESYNFLGQNIPTLISALAKGYPVIFGITVYDSFESDDVAASGVVPLPKTSEQCLGGHGILMVGVNSYNNYFICRNSWGDSWGQQGYFQLGFDYVLNPDLAADFTTIELVK